MPKFKRQLQPGSYLTAADMLDILGQQSLTAAALPVGRIVLATDAAMAWLLDACCVGRALPLLTAEAAVAAAADGDGLLGSAGTDLARMLAAVTAAAGSNAGGPELQAQHELRLLELQARQQRRRRGRLPAAIAPAQAGVGPRGTAPEGHRPQPMQPQQQQQQQQHVSVQLPSPQQQQQQQQQPQQQAADTGPAWQLVQLSLQEAMFLSHVLGCCSVFEQRAPGEHSGGTAAACGGTQHGADQQQQQDQQPLTPPQLWRWCCRHTQGGPPVFASQYAAYHHLRALGWLPQPGLMYGGDYVVYTLHPEVSHSEFVVTVMLEQQQQQEQQQAGGSGGGGDHQQQQQQPMQAMQVDGCAAAAAATNGGGVDGQLQQQQPEERQQLAWLDACIMHRLARQVLKRVLLLYVVVPPGLTLHEDPGCVQHLRVREVLVQRWVPGEHREAA